jgi:isocitrate dehydrogenase
LFIKILNITRIFIINTIFKIYNRLFEHLKKTKSRLARKRMIWKRSLIDALIATKTKLIKYYNQIQNELNLLYDKAVLLHSIVDDTLFQIAEWKIEFEKTFWSEMYWNALKEMYYEYKQKSIQFEAQSKQFNSQSINQTLNDILDDDVIAQASFDENEFNVYRRQDMLYDIFF